ncbi:uncharacterized protein LOC142570459 [Dermacentor variabilis]|uniref:uncharacterized protein LOC142570459 n=1 Tax=Dermacentor variabilis TaxID=34621 RepID=UPI003F5B0AD8
MAYGKTKADASASFWLDLVRTVEAVGGREKYHELFLARYNASLPEHESVAKRLALVKDILSILDEASFPRARLRLVVASLAKIAAGIPNTDLDNWQDPVESTPGGFGADETTLVVVRDVHILRAVERLLTAFTLDDLMQHLSWWLVQILTVIGWPEGYVVIAGSQEVARSEVKVDCYRMMASRFALLLASESSTMLFTHDSWLEVDQFFLDLVDFMHGVVSRVPWLSDKDKATFAKTLGDLEVIVWPPDVETSNETLWHMYESFCASCWHRNESDAALHVGLVEFWLRANTRLWTVSAKQIEHMQLLWQWDQLELLHYDSWYNQLRVSHAALGSPIYQPSSPELRKANFGALGTSFFRNVLQVFEVPADDFKSDVDAPSWAQLGDVARLADELNCSAEFLPNVREILALGLAWHAVNASAGLSSHNDRRRRRAALVPPLAIRDERGEEHLYNADQLFFLTYCRTRCSRHQPADLSLGLNCNAAVRTIPDFRHAFKCKLGSPMAPHDECQVSDFF